MKASREFAAPRNKRNIPYPAIAILLALFGCPYAFLSGSGMPASFYQQASAGPPGDQEVKQMLSIAESQHEIIKLVIKQGQYQRVLPEMKKILELNLPEKYEEAVAQSASLVAGMLVERQQFGIAHEVLNEALKRARRNENKAALLKLEGYVYKSEGNLEKAVESLEKAVQLERVRVRPQ